MKIWTQDMLPLTIVKDLGLIYPTEDSKKKSRYIEFQCPTCPSTFNSEPSKVKAGKKTCCTKCARIARTPNVLNKLTDTKTCNVCLVEKSSKDFYSNSRTVDELDKLCKECADANKAAWVAKNTKKYSDSSANARLVQRYGVTLETYTAMEQSQKCVCKICGGTASNGRGNTTKLSVDHCHTTGVIRGLLCQKCNTGLGLLGDTIEGLEKALKYLRETM